MKRQRTPQHEPPAPVAPESPTPQMLDAGQAVIDTLLVPDPYNLPRNRNAARHVFTAMRAMEQAGWDAKQTKVLLGTGGCG